MFRKAEKRLRKEKGISHEEIRQIAERIAQAIELKTKDDERSPASVVLDFFDSKKLQQSMKELAVEQGETILNSYEITLALQPIKTAILRELKKTHPEIFWYSQEEQLATTRKTHVKQLSEGHVLKELPDYQEEENEHALDALYQLQMRSPFIAYHHKVHDEQTGLEISKQIPLTNLYSRMQQAARQPFEKSISQFLDNVKGVQFLMQNKFVLSDLSLDNLGIDPVTERGILFDLGGLFKKEDADATRYAVKEQAGYAPPEMYFSTVRDVPGRFKREPQSIFELGVSLRYLLEAYKKQVPDQNDLYLIASLLVEAMTNKNPANRPSVEMVLKDLSEFLERTSEEVPLKLAA